MRVKSSLRALLVLTALCLTGFLVQAQEQNSAQQAGGDPLAEAARKAREEKKNAAKPKKVYTDDDVKGAPSATSTSSASSDAAGNAAAAGGAGEPSRENGKSKEDPNSEKAWRSRFQAQRDKIAKAEQELSVLQREADKDQVQYYSDPQKALAEQNTRGDINDKKAKIEIKQKELEHLKQGLADLEDQLRKAGGDPGWAR